MNGTTDSTLVMGRTIPSVGLLEGAATLERSFGVVFLSRGAEETVNSGSTTTAAKAVAMPIRSTLLLDKRE